MAQTILVSSIDGLHAALAAAKGGETILLAPGHYGELSINPRARNGYDGKFPTEVTITSADASNPASFGRLFLDGVTNMTFSNLLFDYRVEEGVNATRDRPFRAEYTTNVKFLDNEFRGDVAQGVSETADGFGTAIGLSVTRSVGAVIEGNELHSWHRGLIVSHSDNSVVRGNEVHDFRSDGMNFVAVQGILIEDNHIHSCRASRDSGDHADMIQFWTSGTSRPTTDVVIRNNLLDIADGSYTQSIFMRNESVDSQGGGREMYYRNILIENNTIYNSHTHGITVGEVDGLIIRNNSVIRVADQSNPKDNGSGLWTPSIRVKSASENVEIVGNASDSIVGHSGQATWTVKNNAFIQSNNPFAPGFYGDVFVGSTLLDAGAANGFIAKPGGMLDLLGAGSTLTRFDPTLAKTKPLFDVSGVAGDGAARVFDASLTAAALGKAAAEFVWTFSDGTREVGPVVQHKFPEGGIYGATLTVVLIDGTRLSAETSIGLAGREMISFNAKTGSFHAFGYGQETVLAPVESLTSEGIKLGATGVVARVEGSATRELRGSDDFEIAFTLRSDAPGNSGELFRFHGAMVASVNSSGQLSFLMSNTAGSAVTLRSDTRLPLNDGKAHDVVVRFVDGKLSISVDGTAAGSMAVAGTLPTGSFQGLAFGNAWGKANFAGTISAFDIRIDVEDYTGVPSGTPIGSPAPQPDAVLSEPPVLPSKPAEPVVDDNPTPPSHPDGEPEIELSPAPEIILSPAPKPVGPRADLVNETLADSWNVFKLDLSDLAGQGVRLVDHAHVANGAGGPALRLDGHKDHAALGRIQALEKAEQVAATIEFTRETSNGTERLFWNNQKFGVTLIDDAIQINVATAKEGFKQIRIDDAGVGNTATNRVTVLLDAAQDRMQVFVNNDLKLDERSTDFDLQSGSKKEWGWTIGNEFNRHFSGDVHDFRLGDWFEFLDDQPSFNGLA
ncbi:MAG: right-handed parallel beta-helix repeat-containing protein [Gemmobacter sp.]